MASLPANPTAEELRELVLALRRARDDADRRAAETSALLAALETLILPLPPGRMALRVLSIIRRVVPFRNARVLAALPDGTLEVLFSNGRAGLGARWTPMPALQRVVAGEVLNLIDLARATGLATGEDPILAQGGGALVLPLPMDDAPHILVLHAPRRGAFHEDAARTVRRLSVLARQARLNLEARRLRAGAELLQRAKAASDNAAAESARREHMVRGVLDAIPVGVVLKGEDLRYRFANRAAAEMLGLPAGALDGRRTHDLFDGDFARRSMAEDQALLASGQPRVVTLPVTHPDGRLLHLELTKGVVVLEQDRLLVTTAVDMTVRHQAEAAILAGKEAAEAANRAKSDFIATMSHEIRTPLNGILGMAQALLADARTQADRRALRVIRGSGDLLLGLIDNILDMAKLEAGKLTIHPTETDAAAVVHQATALWADCAREKGLHLARIIPGDLPSGLRLDKLRLAQVLNNLIGNAVKFTERGQVVVRVGWRRGPPARLWVSVEDSGPGIAEEAQARLFRRFSQLGEDARRRFEGAGLGLSICQDLVRMMGGRIELQSTPGAGSLFRFELPAEVLDARPRFGLPLAGRIAWLPDDGSAKPGLAALVGEHLASMGASVMRAPPVVPPFLVLSDARRAGRFDAAAPGARRLLLEDGGPVSPGPRDLLLRQPQDPLDIYAPLARWLGDAAGPPAAPLLGEEAVADYVPPPGTRILVAEDNPVNQAVLAALLGGLGLELRFAQDGAEAVEQARHHPPDLVLMDVQMPGMDGIDATRLLRAEGYAGPIIMCTANILPEAWAASQAAGADHHLRKPVNRAELLGLLAKLLAAPRADAPPVFDPTPLRELEQMVGGPAAAEIAALFRADAEGRVARGAAALTQGDLGGAAREFHALKSSAASLGAVRLSQIAARLEAAGTAGDAAASASAGAMLETALKATLAALDGAACAAA